MHTLRVPNRTSLRWSENSDSKRPYVVERHESCREHHDAGKMQTTTFTVVVVGRYATEDAADRAACRSGECFGGFVQGMRGLLGLYPKPHAPRTAPNTEVSGPPSGGSTAPRC